MNSIESIKATNMTILYYDDIEIGATSSFGDYEITKDEVVEFASRWDPQPFHIDEQVAEASIYGSLTASGSHIMAIRTWLLFHQPGRLAVIGALGWDEVRFPNPARVGDRLSVTMEYLDKKESQSKPDRGIVRARITVTNQKGTTVLEHIDVILVAKRGAAVHL